MPITSLGNMSVDASGANSGLLMPKLQYRFRVRFPSGFGGGDGTAPLTKQVIDVTRPTVSFTDIPIDVYNSTVHVAGKHAWEPVTLNLRDDINHNVSKLVGKQLQSQFDFYEQSSPTSGQDYKFRMDIDVLDGGNGSTATGVLETWSLLGCYIENAAYNQLAYSASEAVTITLSIRFDNALQTDEQGNVTEPWSTFARTAGTLASSLAS